MKKIVNGIFFFLQDDAWGVGNKQVALAATLQLIRIPPFIAQSTRCSLLKACFTAVFPGMVAQQNCSREDSDAAAEGGRQRQMVEKLQTLVRELLKQEMEQSTLDEIFTLLEPWLKRDCPVAREMSITILHSCLDTYLERVDFKVGNPTSFAPGPYIIGSVIPRCFDSSRAVQSREVINDHLSISPHNVMKFFISHLLK